MALTRAAALFLRIVSAAYALLALVAFIALLADYGPLAAWVFALAWYATVIPSALFGAGLWGWIGLVCLCAAIAALGFLGAGWLERGEERGRLAWLPLAIAAWAAATVNFLLIASPLFDNTQYARETLIDSFSDLRERGMPSALAGLAWAALYTWAYRRLEKARAAPAAP